MSNPSKNPNLAHADAGLARRPLQSGRPLWAGVTGFTGLARVPGVATVYEGERKLSEKCHKNINWPKHNNKTKMVVIGPRKFWKTELFLKCTPKISAKMRGKTVQK